jgi:hypothetical protein
MTPRTEGSRISFQEMAIIPDLWHSEQVIVNSLSVCCRDRSFHLGHLSGCKVDHFRAQV